MADTDMPAIEPARAWPPRWRLRFTPRWPMLPNAIKGATRAGLLDLALDLREHSCEMALPYPAPQVGLWQIRCTRCGIGVGIPVLCHASDPERVRLRCASGAWE